MDPFETFNRLDLDDDPTFYKQIESVTAMQCVAAVNQRQRFLAVDAQASFGQLEKKTLLVGRTVAG